MNIRILNEIAASIESRIKPGQLPGDGTDETAERNGLIIALNIVRDMMLEGETEYEKHERLHVEMKKNMNR